jgi:hypothetical protein
MTNTGLTRKYKFRENGDKSWNLRVWDVDQAGQEVNVFVHTNKNRAVLEKILDTRYLAK